MKIKRITIENYKGISIPVTLELGDFSCIVGRNDVGKSTLLKAIDAFLNDNAPTFDDKNIYTSSNCISIELQFDFGCREVTIDDAIPVTFEEEELVSSENLVCIKKVWDISTKTSKPKIFILRKTYVDNDFTFSAEKELIALCKKLNIETSKANGDNFNNKEKRRKLRDYYRQNNSEFKYEFVELPLTGQTRAKKIYDCIKNLLPTFEYFHADSSLSDSGNAVQKYFKDKAFKLLSESIDTEEVEGKVRDNISVILATITSKINQCLPEEEKIVASINFDWSKLVSTSFRTQKDNSDIPLNSRGDGFRRITMMSYFEMLAEENNEELNIVYGFEEPETFLHPSMQISLYAKLAAMVSNGFQILVTTHSPNIVAETDINNLIFISRQDGEYKVQQGNDISIPQIISDLGVNANSKLIPLISNTKLLLLVEGPDDIRAYTHVCNKYKEAHLIDKTFDELGVVFVPVGGCGSIKHWVNFDVIRNLGKPYFLILDSDKENENDKSKNLISLEKLGYDLNSSHLTRKREIECYIHPSYFQTLSSPIEISYGDYDDVKKKCKEHHFSGYLGGGNVCERHFCHLTFEQLRLTFCPSGNDDDDEFLEIYNSILRKL